VWRACNYGLALSIHNLKVLHKKIGIDSATDLLCICRFNNEGWEMATFGYARVSTDGQSLASQDAQLHAAGCAKVYAEKITGAHSDRPELRKLLRRLEAGDVLVVTRLDRLARSTRDLLNILDTIAEAGAGFKSLNDSWADTTTPHGRLMLTVLGGLAEFERELIIARRNDGRIRANGQGRAFWSAAVTDAAPAPRGHPTARQWRSAGRYRALVRCQSGHDIEAATGPFRRNPRRQRRMRR
jgi:DNA invertase Pin-like site-specific DNA recombinase